MYTYGINKLPATNIKIYIEIKSKPFFKDIKKQVVIFAKINIKTIETGKYSKIHDNNQLSCITSGLYMPDKI